LTHTDRSGRVRWEGGAAKARRENLKNSIGKLWEGNTFTHRTIISRGDVPGGMWTKALRK